MLNKYKQIRNKFSGRYAEIRKDIENFFEAFDSAPNIRYHLAGYPVVVIDREKDPKILHDFVNTAFVGVSMILTSHPDIKERDAYSKALGVPLDKEFIFIDKEALLSKNERKLMSFFLAHEVGHIFLGHISSQMGGTTDVISRVEFEADFFAHEVMGEFPETIFRKLITRTLKQLKKVGELDKSQFKMKEQVNNRIHNSRSNFSYR